MTLLLGLGIIGSRSADQLLAAGHPLKTWNRTPKDRPDSVEDPVAAAGESEVIISYLRDETAVRELFTKILPELGEGKTFINHSTIDPETTVWLDQQCKAIGCDFLDAPFTGSRDAAAGGNLVYYVSGKPEVLEKHRALLEITSKEILFMGPPPAATVVKITTNLATASAVQALTEALEIARRHGVDPRDWQRAAANFNGCYAPVMGMKIPTLLENDFTPHFSTENMAKDTLYALQLADAAGVTASANQVTWNNLFEAEMRDASEDFSATIRQHHTLDVDLDEPVEKSCSRIRVTGPDAERYLNGQLSNDFTPHFSTENMAKDTLYALQLADAAGVTASANQVTWNNLFEAEMRDASEDFSATIRQHHTLDVDLDEPVEKSCSRIRVTGPDAERYLNGQLSNDVTLSTEDELIDACLLNAKGQLEHFVQVHRDGGDFIIEGPYEQAAELLARLDKYLIADDVELIDESEDDSAYALYPNETRRILDGIPKWPNELFPGLLPPDAGLEDTAISYTKGCYTGQEVISRMKRAGKTNKHLVRLILDKPLIPTNSKLVIDGKEAGWITSVATLESGQDIALGYRLRKFEDTNEFEVHSPSSNDLIGKATVRADS